MEILKEKIVEVMDNINQDWVEALKDSYKKEAQTGKPHKVSSTEMMGKYSENVKKMLKFVQEFEERLSKKGKKGFFK